MGKTKIKVLAIGGSPRKGYNTDKALQAAMESAKMMGDWVETEHINITDYKVKPCIACYKCYMQGTKEKPCPGIKDDMNTEIYPRMMAADVILVGTPVTWGTLSAQTKAWMDRTLPFCHGSNSELKGLFSKKVCGAIVTSWDVHGGTEVTIQCISSWAHVLDMTVVGAGHHHPHGAYLGGAAYTQPHWGGDGWRYDTFGARSIRGTGKRAVEIALMLKLGREKIQEEAAIYTRAVGKGKGKVQIDWDRYFAVQPHCPTIHYRVPEVIATSQAALDKYTEWMSPESFSKREGEAFGEKVSAHLDPKVFIDTMKKKHNLVVIDDEELFNYDPEYFEPWLKK